MFFVCMETMCVSTAGLLKNFETNCSTTKQIVIQMISET